MTPITLNTIRPNGQEFLVDSSPLKTHATGIPRIKIATLKFKTQSAPQFIDLSELLAQQVTESGILNGSILVFSRHTTAGILLNENEPLLLADMSKYISSLALKTADYDHNNFEVRTINMCEDECANGHSHLQHLTIGTSETIPIIDGKMALGQWQRAFLVELDRPRTREVYLQIFGI